jgi:hypothetical protein
MKKALTIAGIVALVAVLAVTAVGAVVLAQAGEDGDTWPFNFRERMHEAIAGILGISVEEYDGAVDKAQEQVLEEAVKEGWLTQEQADQMQERFEGGAGPGMMGPGAFGRHGGKFGMGRGGLMGGPDSAPLSLAAEKLDMSTTDLLAELQEGKSIADVAKEKGVDPQTIVDTYLDQLAEQLDAAVENGRITRERADWMLERAGERIQNLVDQPFSFEGCGSHDFRRGGHPGGMWDLPDQNDA